MPEAAAIVDAFVEAGDTFARQSATNRALRWEIGNDRLSLALEWTADVPLHLTHVRVGDEHSFEAAGEPFFGLRTSTYSFADRSALPVTDSRVWVEAGAVRLAITLRAMDGSSIAVHLEAHEGQAIVRTWLEVVPSKAFTILHVEPFRLNVKRPALTRLHTIAGVQQQGGWQAESGEYRSFRLEERVLNAPVRLESGPRSTWTEMPWAAFTEEEATSGGIMLALEYGARWALTTRPDGANAVIAAFLPVGLEPELRAGEHWSSPALWIGGFTGDLDSASAVMHDYMRAVVVPPRPDDFPWVQYNTWFAAYCELDQEDLLREAAIAADLGAEVFTIDAGWWAGNPRRRDHFSTGLGTWAENRDKFPAGLAAFADRIRALGMHVGIWFEPERVDLRTATTGGWEPEWIARSGDAWVRCDWPVDTDTAWLCFGLQETQDWAFARVSAVIAATGARWLKWDSNFWGVCDSPDHDHGTGDGEAAQIAGVYAVLDRLRARFPDLVIENCAGGATRMDFAIARHTHVAWLDDASEPAHRSRQHTSGAAYLYPPEMLNAWVTESRYENLNHQDLPDPIVRSMIRSRMLGALGISCRVQNWSATTRRIVREEVDRYARSIRHLVRRGHLHHLLPTPVLISPDLRSPNVWEAYAVVSRDRDEGVAIAFRNASPERLLPLRFKDLDPSALYEVTIEDDEPLELTGRELCGIGIDVACAPLASVVVKIRMSAG